MMEKELINIWKHADAKERIKFEKSRLIMDVQSNLDRFEKSIKYRDLREIVAALIIIPVFSYKAYMDAHILSKIGAGFLVLYAAYVIFRLVDLRKYKPANLSETYLNYLLKTKEYLKVQRQLLDDVLYWYILPAVFGILIYSLGMDLTMRERLIDAAIMSGIWVLIYWLNKRAVKKQFDPRIRKVDELIDTLNEYE